jgi:DnaK suppressor protein
MSSVACTGFWLLTVISGLKLKAYSEGRYMIMKNKDLEYFRKMLIRWREDLYKQADVTVTDLQEPTVKAIDPVDQASLGATRDFTLRIRDRESRLIGKINQSLARIEEGTFGICDMCGEKISIQRLKARPVTNFCITCKNKMEALEETIGM